MSLVSLPPELILKIFRHVLPDPIDPARVVPLTLVHSSLTSLARQFLFLDLVLHSDRQVRLLVGSGAFERHAALTTSLRFDTTSRGGIGTGGIGAEESISAKWVERVLDLVESSSTEVEEPRLRVLDVRDCRGMKPEILSGSSLKNLKHLELGNGFVESRSSKFEFKFKLESLVVSNNHWESLATTFLESLLSRTCQTSLKLLDLGSLYSVTAFNSILLDHDRPSLSPNVFHHITHLYLPPFETLTQIIFSTRLLDRILLTTTTTTDSSSPRPRPLLQYLELPTLSDPRSSGVLILPLLESLSRHRRSIVEIGFKNFPSQPLVDSILIVLHSLFPPPPPPPPPLYRRPEDQIEQQQEEGEEEEAEETRRRRGECRVERIRMVKIAARGGGTARVSQTMDRRGELVVDLIGQFGCQVEYGPYISS